MAQALAIRGGCIVDGSGNPPFLGDVLIQDKKITKIGTLSASDLSGTKTIDVSGMFVTPGFVDIHRHCDYAVLKEGFGAIELSQGITTVVGGSCGLTPFPLDARYKEQLYDLLIPCLGSPVREDLFGDFSAYARHLDNAPLPVNVGSLIGSCSTKIALKGFSKEPYSAAEMAQARKTIQDAMGNGALGLSMGIMYMPEYYSSFDELVEIAKAAAEKSGILTCHIRGEGDTLVSSIDEILAIAQQAKISLQISHFKSCGIRNWGKEIYKAAEKIQARQALGNDVSVDFYPYTGGATTLLSLIPPAFMRPSLQETWEYLANQEAVEELRASLAVSHAGWDNYIESLGFDRIIITSTQLEKNKQFIGKTIGEIAAQGHEPYGFICRILAEEKGKVGIVIMSMSQDDVDYIASLPYSFLISDALYPDEGTPHPRLYSAFPKALEDLVRDRGILSIQQAIHKMTAMPAQKMKIPNRGRIAPGYYADVNIFDLAKIKALSDFTTTGKLAQGMEYTIVNGDIAWMDGKVQSNNGSRITPQK